VESLTASNKRVFRVSALLPYIYGLLGAAVFILIVRFADKHLVQNPFWRPAPSAYPASHEVAAKRVLAAVDLMATQPAPATSEVVASLVQSGAPKIDAELLVFLVPIAFSWAFFRKLGASSFPGTFFVFDKISRPVELPLAREHYFTTALQMACDLLNEGLSTRISKEGSQSVLMRSAEMEAFNKALASGKDMSNLARAEFRPPISIGITAEELKESRSAT
jgi:hypothetical protein